MAYHYATFFRKWRSGPAGVVVTTAYPPGSVCMAVPCNAIHPGSNQDHQVQFGGITCALFGSCRHLALIIGVAPAHHGWGSRSMEAVGGKQGKRLESPECYRRIVPVGSAVRHDQLSSLGVPNRAFGASEEGKGPPITRSRVARRRNNSAVAS
jgi:hypothetical protein